MPDSAAPNTPPAREQAEFQTPPRYAARIFFGLVISFGLAVAAAASYHIVWLFCILVILAVLVGVPILFSGIRRLTIARSWKIIGGSVYWRESGFVAWVIPAALVIVLAVVGGQNWNGEEGRPVASADEGTSIAQGVQDATTSLPTTTTTQTPAEEYLNALDSLMDKANSAASTISSQLRLADDDPVAMGDAVADLMQLPDFVPASSPPGWSEISLQARSGLSSLKRGANSLYAAIASASSGNSDLLSLGLVMQGAEDDINSGLGDLYRARSKAAGLLGPSATSTSLAQSASTVGSTLTAGTTTTRGTQLTSSTSTTKQTTLSGPTTSISWDGSVYGLFGMTLSDPGAWEVTVDEPTVVGKDVWDDVLGYYSRTYRMHFSVKNAGVKRRVIEVFDFQLYGQNFYPSCDGCSSTKSGQPDITWSADLKPGEKSQGYLWYTVDDTEGVGKLWPEVSFGQCSWKED